MRASLSPKAPGLALTTARAQLAEPPMRAASLAAPLAAATLTAFSGLAAAWVTILGPLPADAASAASVTAPIEAPASAHGTP